MMLKLELLLKRKEEEASRLRKENTEIIQKITDLKLELKDIRQRLSRKPIIPVVTNRAVIRYLERVKGFDIEAIKQGILSRGFLEFFEKFGRNSFTYQMQDYALKVVDSKVITVLV